jgi:hypothetical protein
VKILISFCNIRRPDGARLGTLDASGHFERLSMWPFDDRCATTTGLTVSDEHIFVSAVMGSTFGPQALLITLRRSDVHVQHVHVMRAGVDIHSIVWRAGEIHAVSTGTDEVLRLRVPHGVVLDETVVWRPDPSASRADHHHLNGLALADTHLIVSGFGRKAGTLWQSARDGFIYGTDGQLLAANLEQPHSVTVVDGEILFCESRKTTVRNLSGDRIATVPGYARGIAAAGGSIYASCSIGRRSSRSTGIESAGDPGEPHGKCAIARLDAKTFMVEQLVDLTEHGDEIYDLLAI